MKLLAAVMAFFRLVLGRIKPIIEQEVDPVILLIAAIRGGLSSKTANWLVNLTETDLDNKLLDKLIKRLDKIIAGTFKFSDTDENKTNIDKFTEWLQSQPKLVQDAVLSHLAAELFRKGNPNLKMKRFEANTIVQMRYADIKDEQINQA